MRLDAILIDRLERKVVKTLIIEEIYIDMEVAQGFHCFAGTLFYLLPIGFRLMLWEYDLNLVRLVVGQSAGIHVG